MNLPPRVSSTDKVILFDGVCKLCNGSTQFILKHDKKAIFKLCSVQSVAGQDILNWFEMPTDSFETMLLVEGDKSYIKSEAVLNIVSHLPKPWSFLKVFRIIPRCLRDWLYDQVARNRYRLFGRYDSCVLPSKTNINRFIGDE